MNKKLLTYVLVFVMLTSSLCMINVGAVDDSTRAKTQAAYGTITVDGKIDDAWNKTPYNTINIIKNSSENKYNGWFKVMWDEKNLYVLAKVYTTHFVDYNETAWENDSFEYFVDEGMERTAPFSEGDYQIRSDFNGYVTTSSNYAPEKVKAAGAKVENAFIVEIASPFVTITPKDGQKIGFDVQPNSAKMLGIPRALYGWSESSRTGSVSSSTELYGTLELRKNVNPGTFTEPKWVEEHVTTYSFSNKSKMANSSIISGVTIDIDGVQSTNNTVLLVDDYPAVEINRLAKLIGGTVKDNNTLVKDSVSVKYTAGSRIAEYINTDYHKSGDGTGLMLECQSVDLSGELFVPVSSLMTTFNYMIEFNRFASPPFMEIITDAFTRIQPEVIKYVDDYGAVGDGIHDDKEAILKAYYDAFLSGKPAMVVFGENKTYRVSERMDATALFNLDSAKNFIIDGRGSRIIVDTPTNTLLYAVACENIQLKNISWGYKEYVSTQGRLTSVSGTGFTFEVDEGYDLIPSDEWIKAHGNAWLFTQPVDESGNHPMFNVPDTYLISSIKHLSEREYDITVSNTGNLKYLKPGMRMAIPLCAMGYDFNYKSGKTGQTRNAIVFRSSKNMLVENVDLYGSPGFAVEGGFCSGLLLINDLGFLRKDGYIIGGNSDGIHLWRSRCKILVENCLLEYNLDDHMNTACEDAQVTARTTDYTTFTVDFGLEFKEGDELLFVDADTKNVLGRAYLKSYDGNWAGGTLVVDRAIHGVRAKTTDGASNPCRVFNKNACCRGTVVRNTTFDGSRRFAYINRAPNVLFENNIIRNCGAGIAPSNEDMSGTWEGPFPSSMTIRNNYFVGGGNTLNHYPIDIYSDNAVLGSTPSIDGILLDSNTVEVGNPNRMISIDSVNDLYMFNNTIKWDGELGSVLMPVTITNSDVEMIDGFMFDCPQKVNAVFTLNGCRFDMNMNAKNITLKNGNTSNLFDIINPAN